MPKRTKDQFTRVSWIRSLNTKVRLPMVKLSQNSTSQNLINLIIYFPLAYRLHASVWTVVMYIRHRLEEIRFTHFKAYHSKKIIISYFYIQTPSFNFACSISPQPYSLVLRISSKLLLLLSNGVALPSSLPMRLLFFMFLHNSLTCHDHFCPYHLLSLIFSYLSSLHWPFLPFGSCSWHTIPSPYNHLADVLPGLFCVCVWC